MRGSLHFLARRILLIAGLGLLLAEVKLSIRHPNSTPQTTNRVGFPSASKHSFALPPVQALSGTPSSSRRPPRIRPKRQSLNPSTDEASYGDSSDGRPVAINRQENTNSLRNNNNNNNNNEKKKNKHKEALRDPYLLTGINFADRTDLHPRTKEALATGFGLQRMTRVQAATYEAALEGRSILARSKTGSGKTLAFLLPTLERLLSDPAEQEQRLCLWGRTIGCVVLAPTRELAIQIADQAEVLLDFHNQHRHGQKKLRVACIYGGVKMQRDVRLLTGDHRGGGMGDLPTILVATPSRLLEHLEGNSPLNKTFRNANGKGNIAQPRKSKSKSKFASVLAETKIVVLDETDRLLQKSNQHETQKILGFLARPEKRQTLLFSATFPRAVRRLLSNSSILTKKKKEGPRGGGGSHNSGDDFLEVDCIGNEETATGGTFISSSPDEDLEEGDSNATTKLEPVSANQKRVEESFVVLENMSQFIPSLLTILRREQQRDSQNYKILVFFPAGRLVRFLFQFFTIGGLEAKENLWEIHSRMSQSSRTRASNSFRTARRGILFSSDVSARGLDYPDVSLVVQMGAPSSDQDYIHRIGRTGRAGKVGRGLLVLLPFESIERNNQKRKRETSANSSKPRTVSYRNDDELKEDLQLSSWIKEPESSESLYQKCKDDLEPIRSKVRSGHVVLTPGAQASYKTFLAHYVAPSNGPSSNRKTNGKHKGSRGNNKRTLPPSEILAHAQDFVQGTGLAHTPTLEDDFVSKLGLPSQHGDQ